jgi:hypothetical protein
MGDLRQAKYNEEQKRKLAETHATAVSEHENLYARLANTGIPVQGVAILAQRFQQLTNRIAVLEAQLEQAARNSAPVHLAKVERR